MSVTSTHRQAMTPTYTTHPKVVAGVVLIASLLLFNLVFWTCMGVSWAISPPETTYRITGLAVEPSAGDYFGGVRVVVSTVVGIIITWGFWKAVDGEPG